MMSGRLTPRLARCASIVERYRLLSGAPSVVVALTDRHRTVQVLRAGADAGMLRALAERPVPIGSITKPLAALALLRVAARHGLALDAPVARFVAAFDRPAWRDVRLDELLAHTSGLSIGSLASPWSGRDLAIGTALPRFADLRGSFAYSNLGYEALGQVLEHLEDRPVGEVLAREVLQPLGMEQAIGRVRHEDRHRVPPGHTPTEQHSLHWVGEPLDAAAWEAHLGAAGGSAATLADLGALLRALLAAHADGNGALASEWRAALAPRVACEPQVHYGLGLFRGRSPQRDRAWHAGGVIGHRTLAMADLRHGFGVAVLTDLGGPLRGSLILRLGHGLLDLLAGAQDGPIDDPQPTGAALEETFRATDGDERIRFEDSAEGWRLHLPDGQRSPLQWTEARRCMTDHGTWREFEFRLEAGPSGAVQRVLHGSRVFAREPVEAPVPPPALGIAGLYRSRNPWAPRVRVTEGPLGPMIHVAPLEGPLVPLGGTAWRVAGTPEVVTFGALDDGTPLALDLSGGLYARAHS
jgi:CubicO group peptidase (beta-lactamase class C family)